VRPRTSHPGRTFRSCRGAGVRRAPGRSRERGGEPRGDRPDEAAKPGSLGGGHTAGRRRSDDERGHARVREGKLRGRLLHEGRLRRECRISGCGGRRRLSGGRRGERHVGGGLLLRARTCVVGGRIEPVVRRDHARLRRGGRRRSCGRRGRRRRRDGRRRCGRGRRRRRRRRQERARVEVPLRIRGDAHAHVHVRNVELRRAARPDRPDRVAFGDACALLHRGGAEMRERDRMPVSGRDRDAQAARRHTAGKRHRPRHGRDDRRARARSDVDAAVLPGGVRMVAIERVARENGASHGPRPRVRRGCPHQEQGDDQGDASHVHSSVVRFANSVRAR